MGDDAVRGPEERWTGSIGHPVLRNMKHLAVIVMMLSLVACGGGDDQRESDQAEHCAYLRGQVDAAFARQDRVIGTPEYSVAKMEVDRLIDDMIEAHCQ